MLRENAWGLLLFTKDVFVGVVSTALGFSFMLLLGLLSLIGIVWIIRSFLLLRNWLRTFEEQVFKR